ncbi:transcription termination factor 4, mitochondrial isoform X2 [Rhinolophus sinicus]|uniref:transcription termination factor 4, mitochondrial isoform X2 n=1 Tax=Rhinolophus sinicus TaxID=89399 RepID=UPI003D7A59C9
MAALGRQVSGWYHLIPLTWARISRQTPQKRMMASLLRKLTTASTGGGLEEIPCAGPKKCVQDPECRTHLPQCLLEKQSAPVDRGSWEREEVITSLLDMGFSDGHVNELLTVQPGTHPQQLLDIVSELILLGVNPEPVCVALKKSPQLLKLPVVQMKKRCSYLRKLGLGEGKLRRVLHCCPEILTMRQRDIANTVSVLRDKCLFTVQQVTEILHRCPYVLREDPGELEYKFQKTKSSQGTEGQGRRLALRDGTPYQGHRCETVGVGTKKVKPREGVRPEPLVGTSEETLDRVGTPEMQIRAQEVRVIPAPLAGPASLAPSGSGEAGNHPCP